MSENENERQARTDQQITEVLRVVATLAKEYQQTRAEFADVVRVVIENSTKLNTLTQIVDALTQTVGTLTQTVGALNETVSENSNKLDALTQTVGALNETVDEFKRETDANFERTFRESRVNKTKVDKISADSFDSQSRLDDLENRVLSLENKIAA